MSQPDKLSRPLLRGSVTISKALTRSSNTGEVCRRLQAMFFDEDAGYAAISGSLVCFSGSMFRYVWTGNILWPFGKGLIQVEDVPESFVLTYQASFLRLVCYNFLVFAAVAYPFWRELYRGRASAFSTASGAIIYFAFSFGITYLVSMYRFPIWLRSGLVFTPDKHA